MSEETPSPAPAAAPVAATAPAPAAGVAVAPAAPVKAPEPPVELAPEGMLCKVCGERLKVTARRGPLTEYTCSKMKDDSPILEDKYLEWRDHWLGSRILK